jgi:hypothetical protein
MCKEFSKNKATNITFFGLGCVGLHDTWLTDATHRVSTYSLLTFNHVTHCGFKVDMPAYKKSESSVYVGDDSLLHVYVCCSILLTVNATGYDIMDGRL